MKQLLWVALLVVWNNNCRAQQELLLKWEGDRTYFSAANSLVFYNDTMYVLTTLSEYDTANGNYIRSGASDVNAAYKIADNKILHKRKYDLMQATDVILMRKNVLWLPHDVSIGTTVCSEDPLTGTVIAKETTINEVTLAGSNLDTISSLRYNQDICGNKNRILQYGSDSAFNISSLFSPVNAQTFEDAFVMQSYNLHKNEVTNNIVTPLTKYTNQNKAYMVLLIYDSCANRFICIDDSKMYVYDINWQAIYAVDLSICAQCKISSARIAYNSLYYAVNYSVSDLQHSNKQFTTVLTKEGQIVSSANSYKYSGLAFTQKNTIVSTGVTDSATEKPLYIQEQDIYQNTIRNTTLGREGVIPSGIYVYKDVVTVTGTSYPDASYDYPYYGYVYTQALSTIPVSTNNEKACKDLIVYRAHSAGNISISTAYADSVSPFSVCVYSVAGQKLYAGTFEHNVRIPEYTLPPDVPLIVRINNRENSCFFKFYP